MSWSDVGMAEDPVRGNIEQFDAAAKQWRSASARATVITRDFNTIVAGGYVGLEGQAAETFQSLVKDASDLMTDVPQVFDAMGAVLQFHLNRLRVLRQEADAALARAKVAKAARAGAASASASSNARIASLEQQIRNLEALPPEQQSGLTTLQHQLDNEQSYHRTKVQEASDAQTSLQNELNRWRNYRASEDELNKDTADKFRNFDLKSLRDPGFLEQKWNEFKDWCIELGEDFAKFVVAAVTGDWEAALWYLRDVLEKVLDVLSVVALIVAIVGTIVTLGALAPILATVTLFLASIKLFTTGVLLLTGAEHPETGQRLGMSDLLVDGAAVLSAALGVRGAKDTSAVFGKGLDGYNAGRSFLDDELGLAFKHGYAISLKQTLGSMPLLVLKGSNLTSAWGFPGLLNDEDLLRGHTPDNELWQGSDGSRFHSIELDIQVISSGDRGITAPCQLITIDATR